jgi:hypothetical protein
MQLQGHHKAVIRVVVLRVLGTRPGGGIRTLGNGGVAEAGTAHICV